MFSCRRRDLEPADKEVVICELKPHTHTNIAVVVVYRPPSGDIEKCVNVISSTFRDILNLFDYTCIVGDFNLLHINWVNCSSHSQKSQLFCDLVNAHFLLQVNTVPLNKHGNILDLVVTNTDNLITGPNEYPAEFDTDHSILEFILNIDTTVNRDISRTAYNFKRINPTFLTNLINDTNLCDNVNACNIDDAWATWNSLVMDIINKCVPKITIKDKSVPPWLDGEVRHLRNQKHAAWSAAKRYDRHSSWRKFKYLQNKLCKMLKNKRHRSMGSMAESILI